MPAHRSRCAKARIRAAHQDHQFSAARQALVTEFSVEPSFAGGDCPLAGSCFREVLSGVALWPCAAAWGGSLPTRAHPWGASSPGHSRSPGSFVDGARSIPRAAARGEACLACLACLCFAANRGAEAPPSPIWVCRGRPSFPRRCPRRVRPTACLAVQRRTRLDLQRPWACLPCRRVLRLDRRLLALLSSWSVRQEPRERPRSSVGPPS